MSSVLILLLHSILSPPFLSLLFHYCPLSPPLLLLPSPLSSSSQAVRLLFLSHSSSSPLSLLLLFHSLLLLLVLHHCSLFFTHSLSLLSFFPLSSFSSNLSFYFFSFTPLLPSFFCFTVFSPFLLLSSLSPLLHKLFVTVLSSRQVGLCPTETQNKSVPHILI
jgi:hypothetical protein